MTWWKGGSMKLRKQLPVTTSWSRCVWGCLSLKTLWGLSDILGVLKKNSEKKKSYFSLAFYKQELGFVGNNSAVSKKSLMFFMMPAPGCSLRAGSGVLFLSPAKFLIKFWWISGMLLPVPQWLLQERFWIWVLKNLREFAHPPNEHLLAFRKFARCNRTTKMSPNISKISSRATFLHRYLWKLNYSVCSEYGIILSVADSWSERFCKITFVLAHLAASLSLAVNQFYEGEKKPQNNLAKN